LHFLKNLEIKNIFKKLKEHEFSLDLVITIIKTLLEKMDQVILWEDVDLMFEFYLEKKEMDLELINLTLQQKLKIQLIKLVQVLKVE
jgi:hypothetical protein